MKQIYGVLIVGLFLISTNCGPGKPLNGRYICNSLVLKNSALDFEPNGNVTLHMNFDISVNSSGNHIELGKDSRTLRYTYDGKKVVLKGKEDITYIVDADGRLVGGIGFGTCEPDKRNAKARNK